MKLLLLLSTTFFLSSSTYAATRVEESYQTIKPGGMKSMSLSKREVNKSFIGYYSGNLVGVRSSKTRLYAKLNGKSSYYGYMHDYSFAQKNAQKVDYGYKYIAMKGVAYYIDAVGAASGISVDTGARTRCSWRFGCRSITGYYAKQSIGDLSLNETLLITPDTKLVVPDYDASISSFKKSTNYKSPENAHGVGYLDYGDSSLYKNSLRFNDFTSSLTVKGLFLCTLACAEVEIDVKLDTWTKFHFGSMSRSSVANASGGYDILTAQPLRLTSSFTTNSKIDIEVYFLMGSIGKAYATSGVDGNLESTMAIQTKTVLDTNFTNTVKTSLEHLADLTLSGTLKTKATDMKIKGPRLCFVFWCAPRLTLWSDTIEPMPLFGIKKARVINSDQKLF